MKILVVNWRDIKHPKAGGAEVHVHEMAKRWVSWGNQVTVLCGSHGKNYGTEYVDGVYYVRKGNQYSLYLHTIKFLLTNSHQFDVVLEVVNTIPFFASLFSRARCVSLIFQWTPFTLLLDETNLVVAIATYILQAMVLLFYRSMAVITISNSAKYELSKHGLRTSQIIVIHPCVNQRLLNDTEIQKEKHDIVYMGRLKKYKGVLDLIKAFKQVTRTHSFAKLFIVGSGDLLPEIRKLVQRLQLDTSVIVMGYLSEEEKINLLRRCAIFVYPGREFDGGWSISCLEAMAMGCIPIVSSVLADMVYESSIGLIYPAKREDLLAMCLVRVLSEEDSELMRSMVRAREWARRYDWDTASRLTLATLRGVVRK